MEISKEKNNFQQRSLLIGVSPGVLGFSQIGLAVVVVFIANILLPAFLLSATPSSFPRQDTEVLLDQLDHESYLEREAAQNEIGIAGESAIEPLARKLIDCSPETCSRIKRILQQIAEDCNEDSLFKILAVLKSRFEISDQQIQPLLERWAVMGRKSVIQRWRDQGATVKDPNQRMIDEGIGIAGQLVPAIRPMAVNGVQVLPFARPGIEFRVAAAKDLRGQAEKTSRDKEQDNSEKERPAPEKKLPVSKRIEAVLANTLDQNIKLVLGKSKNGQSFRGTLALLQSFPVEVALDEKWRGSVSDFSRATGSRSLPISKIELDSITLDSEWVNVLLFQPLESFTISNCVLADDVEAESGILAPTVTAFTIKNSQHAGELIKRLVSAKSNVYRLGLSNCPLDAKVFAAIQKMNVMSLELENMDLKKKDFDRLKVLPKLRQLNLSRCRFSTTEFRAFETTLRGRVRLDFTAKAFLGVRGNTAPLIFGPNLELNRQNGGEAGRGRDCMITEVVPGSAADDAGVNAGDVIVAIGKQEVVDFSDLRVLIAQYGVGDEIAIWVQRDGKKLELKTTLGDFTDAK